MFCFSAFSESSSNSQFVIFCSEVQNEEKLSQEDISLYLDESEDEFKQTALSLDAKDGEIDWISEFADYMPLDDDIL